MQIWKFFLGHFCNVDPSSGPISARPLTSQLSACHPGGPCWVCTFTSPMAGQGLGAGGWVKVGCQGWWSDAIRSRGGGGGKLIFGPSQSARPRNSTPNIGRKCHFGYFCRLNSLSLLVLSDTFVKIRPKQQKIRNKFCQHLVRVQGF